MLSGLGCTPEKEALKDYLESTLGAANSVNYTQTERRNVLSSVLNSINGLEVVITFFKDFQLDIMKSYGYTLEALLRVVAQTVKNQQQYSVFTEYLNTVQEELGSPANNNIVTILNSNLNNQNAEPNAGHMLFIEAYLRERGITEAPTTSPTATPPSTTPPATQSTVESVTETTTAGAASLSVPIAVVMTAFVFVKVSDMTINK